MKKLLVILFTFVIAIGIIVGTQTIASAVEEGAECEHVDNDYKLNICDTCGEYISDVNLAFGRNTIETKGYFDDETKYYEFVPQESGCYEIYSLKSDFDLHGSDIYIFDSNFRQIKMAADFDEYNFWTAADFEAGNTYYIAVNSFYQTESLPIFIVSHTIHVDTDYRTNICDLCYEYVSDDVMVLGDNNLPNTGDYVYLKFVPETTGIYLLTFDKSLDDYTYVTAYNSQMTYLTYKKNINVDNMLYIFWEFTAGETYYIAVEREGLEGETYTINFSLHEHVGTIESCQGLRCICGERLDTNVYDHRLEEEKFCVGSKCMDCFQYFGETDPDNHLFLSTTQTCLGYKCHYCKQYVGEPGEQHADSIADNFCSVCHWFGGSDIEVGTHTVEPYERYIRFISTADAVYTFYSLSQVGCDPHFTLYDAEFNVLGRSDDNSRFSNSRDFSLQIDLLAGKTYYFLLDIWGSSTVQENYTLVIDQHIHVYNETCYGLRCDCSKLLNDTVYDHRLKDEQTCMGYQCIDCSRYFGEPGDFHSNVSITQECAGYYCYTCQKYVGEGTGNHFDYSQDNVCDLCNAYLLDFDLSLGSSTLAIPNIHFDYYLRFIPTQSVIYKVYSTSYDGNDLKLEIYDQDFSMVNKSDDSIKNANELDFYIFIELEAGKTYYFNIFSYNKYNDTFVLTLEKHEHTTKTFCHGTMCEECEKMLDESLINPDVHIDEKDSLNNICDFCMEYCAEDFELGKQTVPTDSYNYHNSNTLYRFVPEQTGNFLIYSIYSSDAMVEINTYSVEDGFEVYKDQDDANQMFGNYDFWLEVELQEGQEYFFRFFSHDNEGDVNIVFVSHDECDVQALCGGTYCTKCFEHFSEELDETKHIWNQGDCIFCEDNHDCQIDDWDEDGICTVCEEDAGCMLITNGVSNYYRGFTAALKAAVDGSTIVFLENRVSSVEYEIYKNITIDTNGYIFRGEEDGCLKVYGNVRFVDGGNIVGGYMMPVYIYGDAKLIGGYFTKITLLNGERFDEMIPDCSTSYIDVESYTGEYLEALMLMGGNYEAHVIEYRITTEATCWENAIETGFCIYCDKEFDSREVEDTFGHKWNGAYGEGTKSCDGCGSTEEDVIYSGNFATELGNYLVTTAYEYLKDWLIQFADENLAFIFEE